MACFVDGCHGRLVRPCEQALAWNKRHMTRSPLPLLPLHQLTPGQTAETFALLAQRDAAITKENKPYFHCKFKDRYRTVSFMVWHDGVWYGECERAWAVGAAYRLAVTFSVHDKYGPQVEVHRLRPVAAEDRESGFDLANLVESSRFSIPAMWEELLGLVDREIEREPVRQLVRAVYEKHAAALQELPATDSKFYPYRGGWLEHVLSLTKSCILLADHYRKQYEGVEPGLDRDLVLAGALLHDVGRVLEFRTDPLGNIKGATVPGRLYGHVLLGRDLVRQTATELGNVPADFLERLEHVILSHLVHPEWGSPRLPLIPEVLILHHADDLDAKLEMYLRCLSRDQTTGPFTLRDPVLGKPLLKPGEWKEHR